jgi:hypothetical protein
MLYDREIMTEKEIKIGDRVKFEIQATKNPYRRFLVTNAIVKQISVCGRYAIISGIRPWSNKKKDFRVSMKQLSLS